MIKILLSYLTIYIVWGSTYFFIKSAVQTIPAFYVVGLRFFVGGLLLLGIGYIKGAFKTFPAKHEVLCSVFIGILLLIGGNGLVTIAEKKVDSYLTALIVASVPIMVLLIDRILFGKRVSIISAAGSIVGIIGVALLFFDGTRNSFNISPHIITLFAAVFFWPLGTSLSKVLHIPKDAFVNSGIQLFSVGIIALVFMQFYQPAVRVEWHAISSASWCALLYLSFFGSMALGAYAYLLKHEPNHRIVSYALVNPVIAVIIGIVIGGETSVPYLLPGMTLILAGLFLMLYGKVFFRYIFRKSSRHEKFRGT